MEFVRAIRTASSILVLCCALVIVCTPVLCFGQVRGSELTVAAAADLTDALKEIASRYERTTGNHVRLVFGSSGNLAAQIRNGAPFDVFLSADMDYPRELAKDGFAEGSTLSTYAVGALSVLVPAKSNISFESRGLDALLDPSVRRIAIANPAHAPYGRAAEALLRHAGLYDKIAPKLVIGENIAQAAQFVASGNAQVGIISRSQATAAARGGAFHIWSPPPDYPPILQGAVVLSHSRDRERALRFLEYLKGPEALKVFTQYGFAAPASGQTNSAPKKR